MSRCSDESEKLLENNKLECTALLFDLDGVLIDSSQCITRHWQAWAERHGLDIEAIMQVAHGLRAGDTMRQVAPHLDVEAEEREYLAVEENDHAGVVAIAGAGELLSGLPDGRWAIVTSAPRSLASRRLGYVGLPVPGLMVTAEDVRAGKPSPEPYLAGAARLGVAAGDCVVIEDAPAGIQAGKRAGMRVVGVAATHPPAALLEAGADAVVGRLSALRIRVAESDPRLIVEIG
jgi:sugar-phosphatase